MAFGQASEIRSSKHLDSLAAVFFPSAADKAQRLGPEIGINHKKVKITQNVFKLYSKTSVAQNNKDNFFFLECGLFCSKARSYV